MTLKLVPYSEEVFNKLFEWQNIDEIRKDMGGLSVPMKEAEMFNHYKQFLNGNSAVLGVKLESGEIIGAFIMEQVHPRHKRLNIHIVFDPKFSRHVKEGCKMFFDYAFNENSFECIHCVVADVQEKTLKLVNKLGFVKIGTAKNHFNFIDGWSAGHFFMLSKNKRKI